MVFMIRKLFNGGKNLIALFALLTSTVAVSAGETVQNDGDYPISFDASQGYTHASRRLNSVSLKGSNDVVKTIALPTPLRVYSKVDVPTFTARAGERVTPSFGYSGTWMHGYVYLDRGQDGAFEAVLGEKSSIPEGSDIMAFSYAETELGSGEGYNSAGERVNNADVLNPPSFVVPSDLANGFYRMRYKVDWASIDPAGRPEDGNGIIRNGGAVCDVRINIHGDYCNVNVVAENGNVLAADGKELHDYRHLFGRPLKIKVVPAAGYMLDALRIRHGYNLDGLAELHGVAQYSDEIIPGYLVSGGEYELPAEFLDGDVRIECEFVKEDGIVADELYALSFDKKATLANVSYKTEKIAFKVSAGRSKAISVPETMNNVYCDMMPLQHAVQPGAVVDVAITAASAGLHYYMYVDYNNDGKFSAAIKDNGEPTLSGELVSYTFYNGRNSAGEAVDAAYASLELPSFTVSPMLPAGVYRARLKADINNIDPAGSSEITTEGGAVIDFLINVNTPSHTMRLYSTNGNIYGANNTALPVTITPYTRMNIAGTPVAAGYVAGKVQVKHGHNLSGEQYINGNRQWSVYTPQSYRFTLPADSVDGDVEIYIDFVKTDAAEYHLVFSDEFNSDDYTQPDNEKWIRCQRQGATWNRWLSNSKEVVYLQGGDLVTRAIPNPDTSTDNVPMITGGIKSNGRFGFTYGYVEARIFTNPWVGNFPAFWMMPENQSAGWPDCGEIDIWETIDAQHRSWHTVHSNWTYDLGYKNNPKSSYDVATDLACYHTYGLEWDENSLVWYVDGKEVGRYAKSTDAQQLSQGQWPFDKHFHLILNQSVGNGSWAANADVSHTYETRFDWVRVYQKDGMKNTDGTVGIADVELRNNLTVQVEGDTVIVSVSTPSHVQVCDVAGRSIYFANVDDCVALHLGKGFYIVNGQKVVVR